LGYKSFPQPRKKHRFSRCFFLGQAYAQINL
jgi:hypothetical protein